MATSVAIQSLVVGNPFSSRKGLNQFILVNQTPRLLIKRANMRVRSMAAEDSDKEISPNNPSQSLSTPPPPPPPAPKAAKVVSTKFEDVLAFSGPAPERINGRLAMIGFVAAMGVELARGQGLFSQINEGGVPWFLGTSVVFTLASLVPLFKGIRADAKSDGVMTSDAELWNGRFAMLGLVALAFTEYVKGGALV